MNYDSLIEQLSSLDATQIGDLRSKLEDKWGIKVATITVPSTVVEPEPEKVDSSEFAVFLATFTNKMGMIKALREATGFGLMQAKEFVEKDLPKEIKTGLTSDEANELKRKLEEFGSIEIRPV